MTPVPFPVTTAYRKPGSWAAGYHPGEDRACVNGTDAVATRDCSIVYAGWNGWGSAYGLTVIMEAVVNGQRLRCIYAHLQSVAVKTGQTVKAGQKVADTNNTGRTTGPHLHQEVRHYPYSYGDDIAPSIWNASTVADTKTPSPGTVTVFDVSFWAQARERWYTPWAPRAADIIREIRGAEDGSEASVWGFTEVYEQAQVDTLTEAFAPWDFVRVAGRAGLEFWYNDEKWDEERPPKSYPSGVQDRWALVTHLTRKTTGQHVAFVTFHGPITYDSAKTAYGQWLVRLLGQIDGPILLMGDANRSAEDRSPRKEIRSAGFRDMRDQARITNSGADEFPSKGWNLSDIWTDLNDVHKDTIVGGQIDLTTAKPSDHRRLEATVKVIA